MFFASTNIIWGSGGVFKIKIPKTRLNIDETPKKRVQRLLPWHQPTFSFHLGPSWH